MTTRSLLLSASVLLSVACADAVPASDTTASDTTASAAAASASAARSLPQEVSAPAVVGEQAPRCSMDPSERGACGIAPPADFGGPAVQADWTGKATLEPEASGAGVGVALDPRVVAAPWRSRGLHAGPGARVYADGKVHLGGSGTRGHTPASKDDTAAACAAGPDDWMDAPQRWAGKELRLGGHRFAQVEALDLLEAPVEDEGMVELAAQLIAFELNRGSGLDASAVAQVAREAHAIIGEAVDAGVDLSAVEPCRDAACMVDSREAFAIAEELARFNTEHCE